MGTTLRRRKVDEKSCVIFLLCDPGWYVHKPDVQNKWDDNTHTHITTNDKKKLQTTYRHRPQVSGAVPAGKALADSQVTECFFDECDVKKVGGAPSKTFRKFSISGCIFFPLPLIQYLPKFKISGEFEETHPTHLYSFQVQKGALIV